MNIITHSIYVLILVISFSATSLGNENAEIFENQNIAISPSGELLAVSWNDSITVFNLLTGIQIQQFDPTTDTPFVFKISPDNNYLLASGWEKNTIWDMKLGTITGQFNTKDNTECGGFSNDLKNIYFDDEYSQFGHKKLVISNTDFSTEKLTIKNSARCNVSPDNKLLALETFNMAADGLSLKSSNIQVIDLNNAKILSTLTGDQAEPYDADMFFFDENRKLLVRDSSIFHIWDLEKNTVLNSWDSDIDVDEISIVKNLMLITADHQLRIWNMLQEPGSIETIPLPESHKILSARLSNDGKLYAITSYDEENEENALVSIFDTQTNNLKHSIETTTPIYGAHFTKGNNQLVFNSYPIKIINVSTGEVMHQFIKADN